MLQMLYELDFFLSYKIEISENVGVKQGYKLLEYTKPVNRVYRGLWLAA